MLKWLQLLHHDGCICFLVKGFAYDLGIWFLNRFKPIYIDVRSER